MGSPLNAQNPLPDLPVENYGRWQGPEVIKPYVLTWRNYWIDRDNISGPIHGEEATRYRFFNAHSAYFSNSGIWNTISSQLATDLAQFQSVEVAQSPENRSTAAQPVSSSQSASETEGHVNSGPSSDSDIYCLSGFCLGDRVAEAATSMTDYQLAESPRPRINPELVVGLSADEIAMLNQLLSSESPDTDEILNYLARIETVCGAIRIHFVPLNKDQAPSVEFAPLPGNRWQGMSVTTIRRVYSVLPEQREAMRNQINQRFAGANLFRNADGPYLFTRAEGGRSMSVTLSYGGTFPYGRRHSEELRKNASCDTPSLPTLD